MRFQLPRMPDKLFGVHRVSVSNFWQTVRFLLKLPVGPTASDDPSSRSNTHSRARLRISLSDSRRGGGSLSEDKYHQPHFREVEATCLTIPSARSRAFHLGPKSRTGEYLELNVTSTLIWVVTINTEGFNSGSFICSFRGRKRCLCA